VQYAVLAWSHRSSELTRWTDNIRILETLLQQGLFSEQEGEALTEAYIRYRSAAHQLSLQDQAAVVGSDEFAVQRETVIAKWQSLFQPAD